MNQGAGAQVPTVEPGLPKGTWCQKGTQVPGKSPKNVNFGKKLMKTDNFDKTSRIFWLTLCKK